MKQFVRRNWINFCWTACQIYRADKSMWRVFIVNPLLKKPQTFLNTWRQQNILKKVVYNLLINNPLWKIPTMLVLSEKLEENPTCELLTLIRMIAMSSAEKGMEIIWEIYRNYLVLSMDLDIHQKNVRSWVTLVLSTQNNGLLKTAGRILQPKKVCKTSREQCYHPTCNWLYHH